MKEKDPRRVAGQKNRKTFKYDWLKLKSEFIQTELTLTAFAKRRGIKAMDHFFRVADREKWKEDRELVRKQAFEKTREKLADRVAARWEKEYNLFEKADALAKGLMAKNKDWEAIELSHITRALLNSLNAKRMIKGESTEGGTVNKHLHMAVVEVLKAEKDGQVSKIGLNNAWEPIVENTKLIQDQGQEQATNEPETK